MVACHQQRRGLSCSSSRTLASGQPLTSANDFCDVSGSSSCQNAEPHIMSPLHSMLCECEWPATEMHLRTPAALTSSNTAAGCACSPFCIPLAQRRWPRPHCCRPRPRLPNRSRQRYPAPAAALPRVIRLSLVAARELYIISMRVRRRASRNGLSMTQWGTLCTGYNV